WKSNRNSLFWNFFFFFQLCCMKDNLNVFLKACGKLGLKEAQLFHPGDLQDLSTRATVKHQETDRRLKNVLITIYWLGRRAQSDRLYDGPYLNFKAFEGLLGTALYKALQESSSQRSSTARDSGFGDSWYSEREKLHHLGGRGGGRPRRDDSLDSLNSMGSRPHSDSSDTTLKGSSEGEETPQTPSFTFSRPNKDSKGYRRITNILPSVSADYNRFLPTKDKPSGYVPPPLRKKRSERNEDNRRSLNYVSGTFIRSKSTSDIDADAMALRQLRFEELQKYREQIKESDDKWQDDLTKWKNRRRSVNSDIAKKKEEREKIEQITYGDDRRSKTFKEMQEESTNTASIPSSAQKAPEPKPPLLGTQAKAEAPPLALHKEEPQLNSMQPKPPEFSWVSSSLPRSYQKSDSLRLTSVVTPRPFGTQSSRISSLPRAQTVSPSDGSFILSLSELSKSLQLLGKLVNFLVTSVPSRYQQFMTSEDEAQSSSAQSSEEEEKDEVKEDERPKETSITIVCRLFLFACQENFCEMRVNLNQKPNSSRDFGFQSNWDSKGVRVSSIQPGSSAEMCQLQVGDEVLTINGHKVAEMSYTEWKTCMDQALREGSLVMDVRRHGQNNWVRDEPSLPYKSHRTINLTSTDHPTILGPPGTKTVSSSLDLTSHIPPETVPSKEAPAKTASEPISLKNLKRRSEFFEQGKNKEEERRRQEKWQMEQERLLQVYTKSHLSTLIAHLEVNSNNVGTHFPLSSSSAPQTAPPAWEEEERKRKEEQERQRQEEERKKREEQERDLLRLEEQRKRREVQEEQKRRQEAAEQERREKEKALEQQQQWSAINIFTCSSADFKSYQPLSQAELERQQILDKMKKKTSLQRDGSWIRQGSTTTPTSKGESDPQFMRRGESLDNLDYDSHRSSWSPRSNSFVQNYSQTQHGLYSNSSGYGGGYRAQRPVSGFMYRSSGPQCLLFDFTFSVTVFCVYLPTQSITRVSGSQSQLFILQSRSVSGKNICSLCDTPLGKGAAMIIESLGLYFHLDCFKCIDCNSSLGGSEAGAEVRIRNQQLYCNSCYIQAKSKQPTSM
uniref:LIM domain 7a n=1 Tax=Oryzias sinensis TaxID=183150 RepID=A0A8C8DS73_9TELE